MFGTLLESTRSRESQAGFTVMSVVAHVALVAAAAAATTSAARRDVPAPPEVIDVIYTVPDRRHAAERPAPRSDAQRGGTARGEPLLPRIEHPPVNVPVDLGRGLPTIEPLTGVIADRVPSLPGAGSGPISGSYLGSSGANGAVMTPDQVDRMVVLRVRAAPSYPSTLRSSGVEGTVLVRFVVDTLGRVEPGSVDIRDSAHDAFSQSVRAVLPRLRFAPAQVAGRPVRQLVEMPFVFALRR